MLIIDTSATNSNYFSSVSFTDLKVKLCWVFIKFSDIFIDQNNQLMEKFFSRLINNENNYLQT